MLTWHLSATFLQSSQCTLAHRPNLSSGILLIKGAGTTEIEAIAS